MKISNLTIIKTQFFLFLSPLFTSIEIPTNIKSLPFPNNSNIKSPIRRLLQTKLKIMGEEQMITLLMCMGTPPQCLDVIFDTGSLLLWIAGKSSNHPKYFDPDQSSTFNDTKEEISIIFGTGGVSGSIVQDNIEFNISVKNKVQHFNWVLGERVNVDPRFNGIVGFGKSYDTNTSDSIKIPNQEFSLMHYLYDHHIIRKKIFAYKSSKTKGILYLGETGLNYTKHYPKCRAKAKKEESLSVYILYLWTCDIKEMFGVWKGKRMQNSETKINYKMMFDTGANAILLPRALYHDAIDYYSKSSEGQCDYLVNSETLLCKSEIDLTSLVNITSL